MREIIPAILSSSLEDLNQKLILLDGLTDWLQIDIADGQFVADKTVSVEQLMGLKIKSKLDLHLMVFNPEKHIETAKKAGAKRIIFPIESADHPERIIDEVKKLNIEVGIALNPETLVAKLEPYINFIDVALFLSVNPGKQGQKFMPATLQKIQKLRKLSKNIKIEVDGGINLNNISEIIQAGADYFVVGSAILQSQNIPEAVGKFLAKI